MDAARQTGASARYAATKTVGAGLAARIAGRRIMINFDMTTITEAVGALKTAGEIASTLKNLLKRDSVAATSHEAEDKITELYGIIMSAQGSALAAYSGQLSLLQTVQELEKRISDFETWDREKTRYEMKDVNPGRGSVIVYALKPDAAGAEPFHLICAKCYQHRKKSILQATQELRTRLRVHVCPECKADFAFGLVSVSGLPARADAEYNPFKER
jgi:hypothetical protein